MSTSMENAIVIGGTVGGAGAIGYISGMTTYTTIALAPGGLFIGGGIAIGCGLGALCKIIFDWWWTKIKHLFSLRFYYSITYKLNFINYYILNNII